MIIKIAAFHDITSYFSLDHYINLIQEVRSIRAILNRNLHTVLYGTMECMQHVLLVFIYSKFSVFES